ncbi:MAG: FAD-binding protein [Candidatus Aminicenantes bacterium]|nr:FAD-binding protein [Candidatus Aminicenantes bacterium]
MRLFAVSGNPILHSKSPFIFNELFKANHIDAHYARIGPENTEELFFLAEHLGLEGINITSPFKESVFPYLDDWDDQVQRTGSVNTAVFKAKRKKGFNTDIDGVIQPLLKRGFALSSRKVVILGAGGAGKAAALALRSQGAKVVILNRTEKKAIDVASRMGGAASGLNSLRIHLKDAFLVVNTIPGIKPSLNDLSPGNKPVFFDAVYNPSSLEIFCRRRGFPFIPGEEWLLSQAGRSYEIFIGIKPEIDQWDPISFNNYDSKNTRKNISLIGFMGCGKTSLGRPLARKLGFSFIDTDKEIEKKEGMTVSRIFDLKGEAYFREKEREIISGLKGRKNMVMACGGGAVLDEENRRILRKNSFVIWLFNTPEESIRRLRGKIRPLLEKDDPADAAEKIFRHRKEKYFLASDLIISSQKKIKEVVSRAYEEVSRMF